MGEKRFVPELRFPEFDDFLIHKLYGDIYSFYTTNSFSRDKLNYEQGEVYNIHYGDIHTKFSTGFDIEKENVPFINKEIDLQKINKECYCQEGDLVVADASEDYNDIGKTIELLNLNNKKVLAGLHTFLARPNKDNIATGFAGYLLQTWKVRKQIMTISQGTKVLSLSTGRLSKIKLDIPGFKEQQKIATFLISIDERIQLLEKKKESLEEYKKGIMQKIFSQEIRFKDEDGNDYPEWEEKKLGDIGYFQTSSVNKLSNKDEKEVYLVNYMNVYRHEDINNISKKGFQIVTAKDSQIETSNLLKGDILFTPSSETPDDIGHSAVIFEDLDNTVFSYHLIRFRPVMKLNLLYSHYFCNIPSVARQLSRFATGSTRFTISLGNFSKVKIHIPHYNEQQKIASFLSSIDDSIEQVTQQIEHSKTYKKGLLQKMFV